MNALFPAQFIALAGSFILVLAYSGLYLQERRRYLALWLGSFALYSLRSVFDMLVVLWPAHREIQAINALSVLWSAVFLLWGTRLFSGKKLGAPWLALSSAGSLWIAAGITFHLSSPWTTVPTFLLSAVAHILTGVALLGFREAGGSARLLAGWAFILWGLHKADYPLLRPLAWAAPFGYFFGAALAFICSVSIILVYLDKTKRELRESEEKYRSIFENAAEGIFQVTPEGRFLRANPALARICGYESPERMVASLEDLATKVAISRAAWERFGALMGERGAIEQFETRIRRGDGKERWVSVNARAVRDARGEIRFYEGSFEDITERRLAEEELRVSRLHLSEAADLARIAYWEHDEASDEFIFNDPFYALYATTADREGGYRMARDEYLKRFVLRDEARDLGRKIEENKAHPGTHDLDPYEHRAMRRDGKVIHILARSRKITDAQGLVVKTVGVNQDITERKQTEEQLTVANFAVQSAMSAIGLADLSGKVIFVNHSWLKLWGYDCEDDVLGRPISDFAAAGEESEAIQSLQSGREYVGEGKAVRGDGTFFEIQFQANLVRSPEGRPVCIMASFVDISERKATEETLRTTTARLVRAGEVSRTGNWELDLSSKTIHASSGACRIYGAEGELSLAAVQQFPLPEYREMLDQAFRALIRENRPYDVEFKIRRADNGALVDIHSVAEYDPQRKTVFGVIQDVTEKKKLEEQLRQAQKMEAVGTLAGGVAHDFNNILTVIMGFANLVQMSIGPDDRLRPYVDQIVASSKKAADLTQSLLAFSRKQRITLEPHNINDVLRSTVKLLKRLLPEDIELRLDLSPVDAVARLDLNQIYQVLMNLATNARDAMPKGGRLTIKTGVVALDEEFEKSHGFGKRGMYVRLSVSDTGVGMDRKTKERIFDPFFTTKEVGKGTGLGLASAYGIVKQHEGYITVSSKVSEGTTFDIYLPLAETILRQEAGRVEGVRGGNETVLVVEDDQDVRKMMREILEGSGYAVLEAVDGEEGISTYGRHKEAIDLVILDVVMPGKNGRETFDEIASSGSSVKALFVSGYTGDVVLGKGVRSDGADFLQKPLSVSGLLSKVREVLDR